MNVVLSEIIILLHAVRAMMGVPAGGTGFAVEQKKKLLWGSKKVVLLLMKELTTIRL